MSNVEKNLIKDLSCDELGGAIIGLKRQYIVSNCQSTNENVLTEALNNPDVPQPGTSPSGYPNVVLTKRNARVHESDPTKVIIDLEYEARRTARFNREDFQFRVTGGTALQQTQTQFDGYGNQISLTHTYLTAYETRTAGETILNTGEIGVLMPRTTLRFEGVMRTAYPHYISSQWTGRINSTYWAGGAPSTWMCTDVQFSLLDTSDDGVFSSLELFLPAWTMSFEFLYHAETHIPLAYIVDPEIKVTPPSLVANEGVKAIDWYPSRDFNSLFPV